MKTFDINSQEFILESDLEKGFLRGSIWENLYESYKFILENIDDLTEEEQLMKLLDIYSFCRIELTLYLCTHPECDKVIDMLKKINNEKKNLKELIEQKYGALCSSSTVFDGYYERKMPWEEQ